MILSQVSIRTKSRCSCEDCDSADCFSKRGLKEKCSCDLCYNSQTCLFPHTLAYSLSVPESTKVIELEGYRPPCPIETPTVIEPDLSKTRDAALTPTVSFHEKAPKALETVASKSLTTAKNPKPSKIPISTDNILHKSNSVTKTFKRKKNRSTPLTSSSHTKTTRMSPKNASESSSTQKPKVIEKYISKSSYVEIPKVISDQKVRHKIDLHNLKEKLVKELIKKEVIYVYDRQNNTRTVTTKESKVAFRNIQADNNISKNADEESTVNNVDAKLSKKDIEQSTARLTAQVMNVPYSDFESTLPESKSNVLQQVSKYPIDLLKRIKEAYKACSCKVCECIAGKAIIAEDICKCKPCDCEDCKRLTLNIFDSVCIPVDDDGCECIRCDQKDCKGITKNKAQPRICDCQIGESETIFQTGCSCEPCHCLDCSLKTIRQRDVVIARVNENYLNSMCDCSSCACAGCPRGYGMSSEHGTTTRREMSTGVNRHPHCQCEACISEACVPDGNESCWCMRHSKVMSKPFQRDTPDYDICRANLFSCFEPKDTNRNDALTMYASITNTYPQKSIDHKEKCYCDSCECLVCNYKNDRECLNVLKEESVTNYKGNGVQEKLSVKEKVGEYSLKIEKNNCGCEICDCESCTLRKSFKDISKSQLSKKICLAGTCSCSPCECLNMGNEMMEDGKPFYDCRQFLHDNDFNNQSVPQAYSTSRNINNPYSEDNGNLNNNDNLTKTPIINHIPTKDQEEINFFENYPYNRNLYLKKVIPQQYVSSRAENSGSVCNNSNKVETYFKELRQSPSVNSSISSLKDSESLLPISRYKKKSAESSCNSSGHDYPDYLIHFPKTTVQKCLDDVIKSTKFRNQECIKINYMNKPPSTMSTSYKNAIKNKPIPSPPLFRQQNNESPRVISNNCSLTTLGVVSKHICLSSKSSLHRASGVLAIETTSKKGLSPQNIAIERNMTDSQNLKIEDNLTVIEDVIQPNKNEVTKIKKHVTVNSTHDDLERVQDTLTEAREFSKQLVQLLEKYENANKQFDVYKKIEMTDNTTSSEMKLQSETKHSKMNWKKDTDMGSTLSAESKNDIRLKKSLINTNATTLPNKNHYKSSGKLLLENSQSNSSNSIRKVDEKTKNAAISNENILLGKTNKNKVSLKRFDKIDVAVITEPAYIFKTIIDNCNPIKPTKSNNVKDFLNTIAEEKVSDILSDVYKANSEKKEKEQRKKRNFNYMYKRTMTMSKKMNIKPRHENVKLKASVVNEESKATPQETEIKRNVAHASKNDLTNDISKYNIKPTDVHKNTCNKTYLQDKTDTNQPFSVIKSPENQIDYKNAVSHASKNNVTKDISKNNIKPTDVHKNTSNKTNFQNKTDNNQSFLVIKSPENKIDYKNLVLHQSKSDLTKDISKYNIKPTDVHKNTSNKTNLQNKTDTNQPFSVIKSPENQIDYKNAVLHASKNDLIKDISKNNIKPADVHKNTFNKTYFQKKTDKNQCFLVMKSPENKIDYKNAGTNYSLVASKKHQLDTESNYDLEDIGPTRLNFDLKKATQSIPLEPETMASNVQTVFRPDKALVNLQSEVKKLLDLPLLQPFMDKINDICNLKANSESKYTECSKTIRPEKEVVQERSFSFYNKPLIRNMYNSLKVSYVNVRQVSDDSVVVKWDVPENLNNVEGYEVLVDGRSVHKTRSPNKCTAVVTGLPINDSDKILLSIRTLTNIPHIERMPATTIIYRPQVAIH